MAIREASAEVEVACAAETAFAWLADPRNAAAWFASVALPEPPARPLRAGAAWTFTLTRQRGKRIPMHLAEYQPPHGFTWETTYPGWRDNLTWALAFIPATDNPDGATRLRLTIRQRPGPLGWPLLLLADSLTQLSPNYVGSMRARAERAAIRAREALDALPTLSYGAYERRAPREPHGRRRGPRTRR
ncbi:MAG TPA: SRPBCC family protein [Ktedonobacterales bacterium]